MSAALASLPSWAPYVAVGAVVLGWAAMLVCTLCLGRASAVADELAERQFDKHKTRNAS